MLLYKFRSLISLDHSLDILINERLYCPTYKELNDPFEGQFIQSVKPGPEYWWLGDRELTLMAEINIKTCPRICSLSSSFSDVRMWSHYADGHRGIAIEIELDDQRVREVRYYKELFRPITDEEKGSEKIFTRKTDHWAYESEYRILCEREYVDITGCIRRVLLGPRTSDLGEKAVKAVTKVGVPVVQTHLSHPLANVAILGDNFYKDPG